MGRMEKGEELSFFAWEVGIRWSFNLLSVCLLPYYTHSQGVIQIHTWVSVPRF